jgi:hypothetical protein
MIVQKFNQPEFTTYDASLGVSKDNWNVELFGQNISDARGLYVHCSLCGDPDPIGSSSAGPRPEGGLEVLTTRVP